MMFVIVLPGRAYKNQEDQEKKMGNANHDFWITLKRPG